MILRRSLLKILLHYYPLVIYALLFGGLKITEHTVLAHRVNNIRKGWGDWTVWLILVPLWLALIGPVLEFFILDHHPQIWEMVLGGILFLAAGFFSIKGYLDLEQGFTKALEFDDTGLIVTGLYQKLRHPISLGNILFCIACPLFLAAGPTWIPALIGIFGVILRISIEESFMQHHLPDYEDYKKRTWAMIPFLY